MKLEQFKKIEQELKQNFSEKYSGLRTLLYTSSFFGNFMSILLAFFFMSKLLFDSVSFIDNKLVIYAISLAILTGLELFKRSLFTKFSLEFVSSKFNFFKKEVAALGIASIMIISFSFYSSLRGAAEFTSKDVAITENIEKDIKTYSDSVTIQYDAKVNELEAEIKAEKLKINEKDEEQTKIQSSQKLTRTEIQRVKDIKEQKETLKSEITADEAKVADTKKELAANVQTYIDTVTKKSDGDKDKNKSNSFVFVIICTIIEFLILIGIYFDKHYKWISYTDYNKKMNNDVSFQKWNLYNHLLESIYNSETVMGEKIPSIDNIANLCKINGLTLSKKEVTECLKLLTNLKILRMGGGARFIQKDKETAIQSLKDNFKII